jgi:hypothetical protein
VRQAKKERFERIMRPDLSDAAWMGGSSLLCGA